MTSPRYFHLNVFDNRGDEIKVAVDVDRECLHDVFGSDGSLAGDQAALSNHICEISQVVATKSIPGRLHAVRITSADFSFR